jgi:hypothetical protein
LYLFTFKITQGKNINHRGRRGKTRGTLTDIIWTNNPDFFALCSAEATFSLIPLWFPICFFGFLHRIHGIKIGECVVLDLNHHGAFYG